MFEEEKKRYIAGIAKCDEVLKNWAMSGYKRIKNKKIKCEYVHKVPPQNVVETYKRFNRVIENGGGEPCAEFYLVIFHANAKLEFINRLAKIHELEELEEKEG